MKDPNLYSLGTSKTRQHFVLLLPDLKVSIQLLLINLVCKTLPWFIFPIMQSLNKTCNVFIETNYSCCVHSVVADVLHPSPLSFQFVVCLRGQSVSLFIVIFFCNFIEEKDWRFSNKDIVL